jgi:hypothetical protein
MYREEKEDNAYILSFFLNENIPTIYNKFSYIDVRSHSHALLLFY